MTSCSPFYQIKSRAFPAMHVPTGAVGCLACHVVDSYSCERKCRAHELDFIQPVLPFDLIMRPRDGAGACLISVRRVNSDTASKARYGNLIRNHEFQSKTVAMTEFSPSKPGVQLDLSST